MALLPSMHVTWNCRLSASDLVKSCVPHAFPTLVQVGVEAQLLLNLQGAGTSGKAAAPVAIMAPVVTYDISHAIKRGCLNSAGRHALLHGRHVGRSGPVKGVHGSLQTHSSASRTVTCRHACLACT